MPLYQIRAAGKTYSVRATEPGGGGGDTTPPTLSARTVPTGGTTLTATLSEPGCGPSSGTGGFTLGGTSATVSSWTISGTVFTATLAGTVYSSETPTLTYSRAATTDDIHDPSSNFLADFSAASVTNNSTQVAGSATYPTDATIVTPSDTVPNFARTATILSTGSGNWSSPSTWSLGRVPQAGDIVGIKTTHTVTYDVSSTAAVVAVGVAGALVFRTDINTKLTVQHLLVYGEPTMATGTYGTLQVGTAATPVAAGVTAEVVFSDVAINTGTVAVPGPDPAQYGNGLLVWGKAVIHGAIKTAWLRLGAEVNAAATALTLTSTVTGWAAGDTLLLPECRQLNPGRDAVFGGTGFHWELPVIATVAGTTVNLTSGCIYDHHGGEHGYGSDATTPANFYPHVCNLTRNVILRSANGAGTRGHTFYAYRAIVDIRYARFYELGRTSNANLDSATFSAGVPTYIGTNQIGRYAIHVHHVMGPVTTPSNGYQFSLIGNVIDDPYPNHQATGLVTLARTKWGITIHDSSYGLIQDCVVHNLAGASIVTEEGSEFENLFDHCFASASSGDVTERFRDGRSGVGFFIMGFTCRLTNCVATGHWCTAAGILPGLGFYFNAEEGQNSPTTRIPLYKGANTHDGTVGVEYKLVIFRNQDILQFEGCEAYGTATGLTIWYLRTSGQAGDGGPLTNSTILNFTAWHCWEEAWFGYPTYRLIFDGFVVRGDPNEIDQFTTGHWAGDYAQIDQIVRHADIRATALGFNFNEKAINTITYENSYLKCKLSDIAIRPPAGPGGGQGADHTLTYTNVVCDRWGADSSFLKINMHCFPVDPNADLRRLQRVFFNDFDGVSTDDFRLWYNNEQTSTYIMPISQVAPAPLLAACPEAGLTNAQAYVKYHNDGTLKVPTGSLADPEGCCIGGAIAPSSGTTTRSFIQGLIQGL